jgi:hypothetical protein
MAAAPGRRTDDAVVRYLGAWKREADRAFDLESPAYQNVVFFHSFVRRVFFPGQDTLLRLYRLSIPGDGRLFYHAEDMDGVSAEVRVESIALILFANGIGILCLGVEAFGISVERALWINEMMRKVYPSSGRQVRECRAPVRTALILERDGERTTVSEHDYREGGLMNLLPPLAKTITSLLYFLDYVREDYEPVLDERMVVYSYLCLDPEGLPADYSRSEEYQVLLSHFLYVDRAGPDFRYDPQFIQEAMKAQLYTRWAHLGTYYGFTSYSGIAISLGSGEFADRGPREGLLIYRMFETRYYITALVALFYRATLLDFSERVALVSKRLYQDQWSGRFPLENIQFTDRVRAEFLLFKAHWYFDELTNKDEEYDHFRLQCLQYRTEAMRHNIERELEALNDSLHNAYQFRAAEAVNRLAIISTMLGCGAVVTGFYGMNFGHWFEFLLEPTAGKEWIHWAAIIFALVVAVGSLWIGVWMIIGNWDDYRSSLLPRRIREGWSAAERMRKNSGVGRRGR